MNTNEHAPILYLDLDLVVISQEPNDLVTDPDSWFAAVKLMLACIDQGCRDFSTFNDQFSQSESELATLKNKNADLLKTNTEANLTIAALRGQIKKFDISVLPRTSN